MKNKLNKNTIIRKREEKKKTIIYISYTKPIKLYHLRNKLRQSKQSQTVMLKTIISVSAFDSCVLIFDGIQFQDLAKGRF